MSLNIPCKGKKRVVIVGGGFGGLKLARKLKTSGLQVVLLDRNNYHQFPPLIYQVASSGLEPSLVCFPFRKLFQRRRDFWFRIAEVRSVCPETHTVYTSLGTLQYDWLVLAAGTTTNFFGNESLRAGAVPMKTVTEAMGLRNTLLSNFERALTCPSERERDELLNIVVAGGGATGVEIAGVLAEMKRFVLPRDYPELSPRRMHIHLAEAGDRLLAGMSAKSSEAALRFLCDMGVEVLLNYKVTGYSDYRVTFGNGCEIPSRTFIWVSGVTAVSIDGLPASGRGGRIRVDAFNRVEEFDNVFAIGDQCLMHGDEGWPEGHPQLAQAAIQQGAHLARNLCRMARGAAPKPFRYHNPGVMATVGRNRAVAEIGRWRTAGWFAWVLWLVVHLRSILGVRNKIVVLFNWVWSYLTYDQSLRLIINATRPHTPHERISQKERRR